MCIGWCFRKSEGIDAHPYGRGWVIRRAAFPSMLLESEMAARLEAQPTSDHHGGCPATTRFYYAEYYYFSRKGQSALDITDPLTYCHAIVRLSASFKHSCTFCRDLCYISGRTPGASEAEIQPLVFPPRSLLLAF